MEVIWIMTTCPPRVGDFGFAASAEWLIVRGPASASSCDIGRASTISTRSPTLAAFFSSCALYFVRRVTNLSNLAVADAALTMMTAVLSILSLDVTVPVILRRTPRSSCAVSGLSLDFFACRSWRFVALAASAAVASAASAAVLLDADACAPRSTVMMRAMSRRLLRMPAVDVDLVRVLGRA